MLRYDTANIGVERFRRIGVVGGIRRKGRRSEGMAAVEAYCVKCREKREIKDPVEVTLKNGRPALKGTCPVCGTGLFRMLSASDAAAAEAPAEEAPKKEKKEKKTEEKKTEKTKKK
jgi:hypothetical protein